MKELNYEKDVEINCDALDVEWLEQPRLMLIYCKYAAECKRKMDYTKEALEVKKAELDKEIRNNPDKYDIGKVTETAIQGAVLTHPEYQELSNLYIEAKYEYEIATAAVRAIDQKKTALENLVKLHGMSYFAGPAVPRDLSKEWEQRERQKMIDKKVKINEVRKK